MTRRLRRLIRVRSWMRVCRPSSNVSCLSSSMTRRLPTIPAACQRPRRSQPLHRHPRHVTRTCWLRTLRLAIRQPMMRQRTSKIRSQPRLRPLKLLHQYRPSQRRQRATNQSPTRRNRRGLPLPRLLNQQHLPRQRLRRTHLQKTRRRQLRALRQRTKLPRQRMSRQQLMNH